MTPRPTAPRTASGALYQGGGGIGEADLPADPDDDPLVLERGPRTVVVAGRRRRARTPRHSRTRGGWPLVAEIVSGARFGRHLVHGYRALLRDAALGGRVERAVVFGHPTLSREVTAPAVAAPTSRSIAVRGPGRAARTSTARRSPRTPCVVGHRGGRPRVARRLDARVARGIRRSRARPLPMSSGARLRPCRASGSAAIAAELAAMRAPARPRRARRRRLAGDLAARPARVRRRPGSSASPTTCSPGKKVPVHANRGLAGIDGTIATAIGIALASQAGGRARRHPRAARRPRLPARRRRARCCRRARREPRLQVDRRQRRRRHDLRRARGRGGRRARGDRPRAVHPARPCGSSSSPLAYGWEYRRVTTRAALDQALTAPVGGRQLIEVPLAALTRGSSPRWRRR